MRLILDVCWWRAHRRFLYIQFIPFILKVVHHLGRGFGRLVLHVDGFECVVVVHYDFVQDRFRFFEGRLGDRDILVASVGLRYRDLLVNEVALAQELLVMLPVHRQSIELALCLGMLRAPSLRVVSYQRWVRRVVECLQHLRRGKGRRDPARIDRDQLGQAQLINLQT